MSRIGNMPVNFPNNVKVQLDKDIINIEGPKGKLSQRIPGAITAKTEDKKIILTNLNEEKSAKALHGLMRSLIANMIKGVTEGFKKELDIIGVGFRAQVKGDKLIMQIGFTNAIEYPAPKGISFAVDDKGSRITISGVDKHLVGEVASIIRKFKKPEPYKGKGIRYVGEYIRKKAGKAAIGAGAKK